MKKNFCEIICIVDRSGSMESIRDDAIGGFNTFLEEQQGLPGEASLTYVQFDHEYEVVHENKPIKKVEKLTRSTYSPRGSTALLDAMGRTIIDVGRRLHNTKESERPEKVIVVVITDGEENSSKEFTKEKIFDMITQQRKEYSWEFEFLAANEDAIQAGIGYGFTAVCCQSWQPSADGVRAMYCGTSKTVSDYRTGETDNDTLTTGEEK